MPVKVGLGGGLDAVGARPVIDRVQVHAQDRGLAIAARQRIGQGQLMHLAGERRLPTEEHHLHQLLCDAAAAFHDVADHQVRVCRAYHAAHVKPGVSVEGFVLDGDGGLLQRTRHRGEGNGAALAVQGVADLIQQRPIAVVDTGVLEGIRLQVWQVRRAHGGGVVAVAGVNGARGDRSGRHKGQEDDGGHEQHYHGRLAPPALV